MNGLIRPWDKMTAVVNPLASLIIPPELKSGDDAQIISIELSERAELTIETVLGVLKAVTTLYNSISKSDMHSHNGGHPPLSIVKIESGTGLTISFKGVADVVKETKNLIIEMWSKHRHKRAEEITNHNRAISSSIDVLTRID